MDSSGQHRVIRPPNRLNIKVRLTDLTVGQMMTKAHKVMSTIAKSYSGWLQSDLQALADAQKRLQTQPGSVAAKRDLFRIAHDIRGQAASFDYDLASEIGTSLCHYLESHDQLGRVELEVVDAHIDAIRAYMRQNLKGDGGTIGQELMAELRAAIKRTDRPL